MSRAHDTEKAWLLYQKVWLNQPLESAPTHHWSKIGSSKTLFFDFLVANGVDRSQNWHGVQLWIDRARRFEWWWVLWDKCRDNSHKLLLCRIWTNGSSTCNCSFRHQLSANGLSLRYLWLHLANQRLLQKWLGLSRLPILDSVCINNDTFLQLSNSAEFETVFPAR